MRKIATLIVVLGAAAAASLALEPGGAFGPGNPAPLQASFAYAGIRG